MKSHWKTFCWCFSGVFLGLSVAASLGADKKAETPVPPTTPRYSVQFVGNATCITDNKDNIVYLYDAVTDGALLGVKIDLSNTGKKFLPIEKIKHE